MKTASPSRPDTNSLANKKNQTSLRSDILSMLGFIFFLTGGLVFATAILDAIINSPTFVNFGAVIVGMVLYKVGRSIMYRSHSSKDDPV